jgi:glycosyltransferase involved in cell wall biosynthesis
LDLMQADRRIACFFATSGHSGVDRVLQRLLPAIAARGYQVDLLHVRGHGPVIPLQPNLRQVELGAGHVVTALPGLIRYLRRCRPEVLFSDKDRVNRTAILAKWLSGSRARLVLRNGTTVSVDLRDRKPLDRLVQRLSMRHLYGAADSILMPSLGAADDFAALSGIARERIQVVPSPVISEDLQRLAAAPVDHPWLIEKDSPVILGIGELCGRKDFETLIRAFARLRQATPARLIILGSGKRRDRLLALAQRLGVAGSVDLPGFDANPYRFIAHADLFALSSRWEGMPMVLIEALSLGRPIVATDCPSGPRELLAGGRLGRLVPVGDDRRFARAMQQALGERPPLEAMRHAASAYTVQASTDAYLAAMGLDPRHAGR